MPKTLFQAVSEQRALYMNGDEVKGVWRYFLHYFLPAHWRLSLQAGRLAPHAARRPVFCVMNQLADQTSPYLLQHAGNPVDWLPWSESALALAKQQDKPILLSIGYSACHWCHVMAHESFEDAETAELMNRLYINIKVDREERPDLDKIYQLAHSALTERPGGWPLTVFLNPHDQMPIFAGTYFPPEPRHGLPGFRQILQQVHDAYRQRREEIDKQSASLRQLFERSLAAAPRRQPLNAMPLDTVASQIRQQFDARDGGYTPAPKFPHPAIMQHIMRRARPDEQQPEPLLHTALFTLDKMCRGGVFDHIGGGFYRYATDARWMIPHFEKMLYDNGPLLALTTQAWCITAQPGYREAAALTAEWVMREMQAVDGGYYSAQDADSEGEEGKFYVWDKTELQNIISQEDWPLFAAHYCLNQPANFEGRWHLHICCDESDPGERFALPPEQVQARLQHNRQQVFEHRARRPAPGLDDKHLTAWNGLMIQGMACAGRQLAKPHYIESAERAADFVHTHLWRKPQLYAATRQGRTRLNAYLDDYAFMLHALLELLQCNWNPKWLQWATELADCLLAQFEDTANGGFYFTSHNHEQLIQRSKSFADEATPSGNGIATLALQRLAYLTGDTRYLQAAENSLRAAWQAMEHNTLAHCSMLDALQEHLQPPAILILRGEARHCQSWQQLAAGRFTPGLLLFNCPQQKNEPGWLAAKPAVGQVCAYLCQGTQCQPPVTDIGNFRQLLNQHTLRLETAEAL